MSLYVQFLCQYWACWYVFYCLIKLQFTASSHAVRLYRASSVYLSGIRGVSGVAIRSVFVLPVADSTECWVEEGRRTMAERQKTTVCMFDLSSLRISTYEIHEWIYEQLHIPEQALKVIQTDRTKRHVYPKLIDDTYITNVLQTTKWCLEYKQTIGEISVVCLEMAGMGTRRIRIANLPPRTSWTSHTHGPCPVWRNSGITW